MHNTLIAVYWNVFLLLIIKIIQAQEANAFISVNPDTQMLIDHAGREMFFHGTNVVYKHYPFHPDINGFGPDTFSEQDMKLLQELGLNTIRLGMMLPGYVPERGVYNETYLSVIQHIVTTAAKYGIYTLLDMHQDVLSRKFCVGGMPDWIINSKGAKPFPFPLTNVNDAFKINSETGYPYMTDCRKNPWGNYYLTDEVGKAFQHLYSNVDGLRDEWAAFWKKTAYAFRKFPSVIGYELINEPFAGDIYSNPMLLIPGFADKLNLEPAYDALQKAIREVDDQHLIFFEGVTWDFFSVGFDKVPGGEAYRNRSVLSYHYYEPPDFSKTLNFLARKHDLERLKCGGFLTEMFTAGPDFDAMHKMFDLADEYKQSWQGWMYKPYDCVKLFLACENMTRPGKPDIVVQNISRTYPQAVAGATKNYKFNKDNYHFSLVYEITNTVASLRTEIYFNKKMHYRDGYTFKVTPKEHITVHESKNGFLLYIDHSPHIVPGTTITFKLYPK